MIASNKKRTTYYDDSRIRTLNNTVKMWILTDYKITQERNGFRYKSTETFDEFDCANIRRRALYVKAYSQNMKNGEDVGEEYPEDNKWLKLFPNSFGEVTWKIACSRK